jgi:hypothetical protein
VLVGKEGLVGNGVLVWKGVDVEVGVFVEVLVGMRVGVVVLVGVGELVDVIVGVGRTYFIVGVLEGFSQGGVPGMPQSAGGGGVLVHNAPVNGSTHEADCAATGVVLIA